MVQVATSMGDNAPMTTFTTAAPLPAGVTAVPELVAFDLDDTLAPSKTAMPRPMATALRALLDQVPVCVISGGQIVQFRDQVLAHLGAGPDELARLHLMPTCGTRYYTYVGAPGTPDAHPDGQQAPAQEATPAGWQLVYANDLTADQVAATMTSLTTRARQLGLWEEHTWGPVLEDRGSQVTFSALGQQAPIEAKRAWDPDGSKKARLRDAVAADLPELEVRSGGSTSVDVTLKGVDKAYGMRRLAQVTGIPLDRMLFIGDRLDPAGNDYPVKALGVPCRAVTGWEETVTVVTQLAAALEAARA